MNAADWFKDNWWWVVLIGAAVIYLIVETAIDHSYKESPLLGYSQYRVYVSYKCDRNTGVGNDFEWTFWVNDKFITNGSIIDAGTDLYCYAKVVERDSYRYPDVGDNSGTVCPSKTNKTSFKVRVDEYGGIDNAGSYAIFTVTFTFNGYKKTNSNIYLNSLAKKTNFGYYRY